MSSLLASQAQLLIPSKTSKLGLGSSFPSPSPCLSARGRFCKISNSLSQLIDDQLNIPKHVALIMDGNRRWAKARGLPVQEGHRLITQKLKEICNISSKLGIQAITAFSFSTENWSRSKVRILH